MWSGELAAECSGKLLLATERHRSAIASAALQWHPESDKAAGKSEESLLENSIANDYLSVGETCSMPDQGRREDDLYLEAIAMFGAALERLARGYEADTDMRRDLLQEIHFGLWRSFQQFDGRCSLRTWVYRIAHNTATSYVIRRRRIKVETLVTLEQMENIAIPSGKSALDRGLGLERLLRLIQLLKPIDRQIILSYLEDMDAASIGEITGLSPGNVAMKIHRIKKVLARQFEGGKENG